MPTLKNRSAALSSAINAKPETKPESVLLRERIAELETALRDLLKAEEDYGDCNNVAVNQAWLEATRVLGKSRP